MKNLNSNNPCKIRDTNGEYHSVEPEELLSVAQQCIRQQLTNGEGADAVLELVGHATVVPEGIAMLGSGGDYLMIGCITQKQRCEIHPAELVHGGKTLHGLMWYHPQSLQQALTLLSTRADRYPFHKILAAKYPLTEVTQAFQDQDANKIQRAALLPWA